MPPSRYVTTSTGLIIPGGTRRKAEEEAPEQRNNQKSGLIRLAKGAYLEVERWEELTPAQRFAMQIKAHVPRGSAAIVTGEAAAALHGLPLLVRRARIPLANSSVRARDPRGMRDGHQRYVPNHLVRRVSGHIAAVDVVDIDGRRVTDIPKTVIDVCRDMRSENGIVVADAALREYCTNQELHAVIAAYPRARGNRHAKTILEQATDRSESAGESLSKQAILESGIGSLHDESRILLQQPEFYDAQGFVARTDFYLPELNLVVEFDGVTKYSGGGVKATESALVKEQAREKRLKNMHLDVLRLVWGDVLDGQCIPALRDLAERQRSRISAGGLVFSGESGRFSTERYRATVSFDIIEARRQRGNRWKEAGRT